MLDGMNRPLSILVWSVVSLLAAGATAVVAMGDTGILFNCRGDYYSLVQGDANALEPGKRPRSTLQSTLVMKDGQPYAILGSPGGDDQVMGIPRGSFNNLNRLNHQVSKTGSAEVRPAPQFSATSPNRPSSPGGSPSGRSSSQGSAPARSSSMPSSMGRSAPAGHSAGGGGVPHK